MCASKCLECVCACFSPSISVEIGRGHTTCICASERLECVCLFCPFVHMQSVRGS